MPEMPAPTTITSRSRSSAIGAQHMLCSRPVRTAVPALLLAVATTHAASAGPIIGGAVDTGDPAVVMLAAYPTDHSTLFTCTAVVISPTALLTAAHCVDHPGFQFGVFFG